MQEMQETQVRSLGWEDPLEKEIVTHSSIIAWKIPWTEEPGRLQSMGSQRVGHDWAAECTHAHAHTRVHAHTHTHTLSFNQAYVTIQGLRFSLFPYQEMLFDTEELLKLSIYSLHF